MELFEISTWNRHGYIWIIVTMVGTLLWLAGWLTPVTLSALIFGALTNVIHGWSHYDAARNGKLITTLHKIGLLQSPAHHVHHHRGKNASHYCLLTDHINPLVERIGLWPRLETLLSGMGLQRHWWEKTRAEQAVRPV